MHHTSHTASFYTPSTSIRPFPFVPTILHALLSLLLYPTQEPLAMSAASYNALLAVYAVSKVLDERGDQVLEEMASKSLQWDSYTYTALMMGRGDRQEVIDVT